MSLADVQSIKALNQSSKALNMQKKIMNLGSPSLRSNYPVMSTLPTIASPVTGASTITNGNFYNALTSGSTTVNPLFRYPIGVVYRSDYDGISAYSNGYPNAYTLSNYGVSDAPPGSGTFTAGTYKDNLLVTEFAVDGTQMELYVMGVGQKYRVLVDEGTGWQYTNNTNPSNYNGTLNNDNGMYRILFTFGTRMIRNIRLEIEKGKFGGVTVGVNDTVFPCSKPLAPKCIILGDSYTEPTGADCGMSGWSSVACQLLGWEASPSGSGGTGYLNPGPSPRVPFNNRIQTDVINQNPQILIIAGGINDISYDTTQLSSAVTSLLQNLKNALPNTMIFVVSNWTQHTPQTNELNTCSAIKTSVLNCGIPFIDVSNGSTYLSNQTAINQNIGAWINGYGYVGSSSSGNSTLYIGSDATHPTQVGHNYLGRRVATEIYRILNWYGRYL